MRQTGLAHAEAPSPQLAAARLGPINAPALHYTLGDGTHPEAWTQLQQLTQYLG
ncbi:DUF6177 family protein [Streptomyces sp. HUAS TT7]|uniref:DUF6177 family protein n=1 Tax=Streptomyces sp. HUAS TT7 TaxID=3447507 RepID=UPI003F658E0D